MTSEMSTFRRTITLADPGDKIEDPVFQEEALPVTSLTPLCTEAAHSIHLRGFAFVEFYSADDAAEAHDKLDHAKLAGREIAIVFAKDKRKTPGEMRGGRDVGPRGT